MSFKIGVQCKVYYCDRTDIKARELCGMHYARSIRNGGLERQNRSYHKRIECSDCQNGATWFCGWCEQHKDLELFAKNATKANGRQNVCQECFKIKQYNLKPQDYEALRMVQNNLCAICERPCRREVRLSIDHDHRTGEVRGLLCQNCNAGIGMFEDNIRLLAKAIEYLTEGSGE